MVSKKKNSLTKATRWSSDNRSSSRSRGRAPNPYPTEDEEQIILAEYLNRRFGYYGWIHVPNQRWAKVQYLKKLAAMGVKKGFPDILIFEEVDLDDSYGGITLSGMAIELKRQRGSAKTQEQKDWRGALLDHCWICEFAFGAQDAIVKIEQVYGPWKP